MESKKAIHGHLLSFVTVLFGDNLYLYQDPVKILFHQWRSCSCGLSPASSLCSLFTHTSPGGGEKTGALFCRGRFMRDHPLLPFGKHGPHLFFRLQCGVIISTAPFLQPFLPISSRAARSCGCGFAGFVVALTGIFLISVNRMSNFQLNPLGDLFAVFAAMLWAVYSVLTRKIGEFGYNNILVTRRILMGWSCRSLRYSSSRWIWGSTGLYNRLTSLISSFGVGGFRPLLCHMERGPENIGRGKPAPIFTWSR